MAKERLASNEGDLVLDCFVGSGNEERRDREIAYRNFILDLYHAKPVSGHAWIPGIRRRAGRGPS